MEGLINYFFLILRFLKEMINESTLENLKEMLEGETFANKGKKEAADKAMEERLYETSSYFLESSKDISKGISNLTQVYLGSIF